MPDRLSSAVVVRCLHLDKVSNGVAVAAPLAAAAALVQPFILCKKDI